MSTMEINRNIPIESLISPDINHIHLIPIKLDNSEEHSKEVLDEEDTLHLLDKIRHSAHAETIGAMPLSLQACRFELPFDLKLLENLTPIDYLTKYCHLSSRRQYQFKRIFDKYSNKYYKVESSNLYLSLTDLHKQNLTHVNFNELCQLIDLNNQQYSFTFKTYAGILALCERILYKLSIIYKNLENDSSRKNVVEICDFYSLDRKLYGLNINDKLKRLLNAL